MAFIINSKISSDGGGGSYAIASTSGHSGNQKMYEANIVISLDHKNRINIIKSRFEKPKSNLNKDEIIEVLIDTLCKYLYDGRMDVFQEGMKIQLKDAVKRTLKGGELNDNNSVRRKSISNGVNPS